MTAIKKMWYDSMHDEEREKRLKECDELCFDYNHLRPNDLEGKNKLIRKIIGKVKGSVGIVSPFYCDFGANITLGDNFYANHNLTILDCAEVTFGKNVFIGPNCVFAAPGHPIDKDQRNAGYEYSQPIIVGDDVWFGAGVIVLPGVTIGSNCVIGAGSVVNKSIPEGVVAVGNPCRVLRKITEDDIEDIKVC